MALPKTTIKSLWPVLALIVIAWVIELVGLIFLQRSCGEHVHKSKHTEERSHWPQGAGLPDTADCGKVYRFAWWSVWFQFLIVALFAVALLRAPRGIRRFRHGILGLLAAATVLHMLTANVANNLCDTHVAEAETDTEKTRAKVVLFGAAFLAAMNIVAIMLLGDDGDERTGAANPDDTEEPLLNEQIRGSAERTSEQIRGQAERLRERTGV